MNLLLKRIDFTPDGIFGELQDESGKALYSTLEHSYACMVKVPVGTYTCQRGTHQLDHSPKPFETFEIIDVPGHSGILFHVGNYNADSDGCVLLGLRREGSMLVGSRLAFDGFMGLQKGIDQFTLIVS